MYGSAELYVLEVEVVALESRDFPGWARCRFHDVSGGAHDLVEKLPILGVHSADSLPAATQVRCVVIEASDDAILIDLSRPDGIVSEQGESLFRVTPSHVHAA